MAPVSQPGLAWGPAPGGWRGLKTGWDRSPGRGSSGAWQGRDRHVPCSGLCPQPLLFTSATGPWSAAGCSLPCTGHGGWEQPPPCLSFPTAGQGWQRGAGWQEGELMALTRVGHTRLMKHVGGAHAPGGRPVVSLSATAAPTHSPGLSSAPGPSLGPIPAPGRQWAPNYPESAPEGTASRILTPAHTRPWEQEMRRKGDVSGARIPSVLLVLRPLPRSRAVPELCNGRGAADLATAAGKHQRAGDNEGPASGTLQRRGEGKREASIILQVSATHLPTLVPQFPLCLMPPFSGRSFHWRRGLSCWCWGTVPGAIPREWVRGTIPPPAVLPAPPSISSRISLLQPHLAGNKYPSKRHAWPGNVSSQHLISHGQALPASP